MNDGSHNKQQCRHDRGVQVQPKSRYTDVFFSETGARSLFDKLCRVYILEYNASIYICRKVQLGNEGGQSVKRTIPR